MNQYPFDKNLYNEIDVLDYYAAAIEYRSDHKEQSVEIALHVFRKTNPKGMLPFTASDKLERLRYEFGALEAPGWSEDETKTLEESQDQAWEHVLDLVEKAKKARQFKDLSQVCIVLRHMHVLRYQNMWSASFSELQLSSIMT